jgi:hypothetical protein
MEAGRRLGFGRTLDRARLDAGGGVDYLPGLDARLGFDAQSRKDVSPQLGPQPRPNGQAITRAEQGAQSRIARNGRAEKPDGLKVQSCDDEPGFGSDSHSPPQANAGVGAPEDPLRGGRLA